MKRRELLALAAVAAVPQAAKAAAKPKTSPVLADVQASADKAIAFLRKSQKSDGSWQNYPGITAVDLAGIARNGVAKTDPMVAKAADYLAALAKPNGAIYTDALGPAQALPNYNTALSILALSAVDKVKYAAVIKKAQDFLSNSQYDSGEGIPVSDHKYGGIGYGSREDNPDLSNLQNALEALRETGYPKNSDVFKKAITFIQRTQNRKESNDQEWANNDGGFVYAAGGESKADQFTKQPHSSYGSMTYAGVKSYLYCSVVKTDPRVQAAWGWLRGNYSVEENPKMGSDGLYYYYHTMSKTLALWGDKTFTDAGGTKREWATDLAHAIIKRQAADGSWVNTNPRWRENDPMLVTGYALVSLANCRAGL